MARRRNPYRKIIETLVGAVVGAVLGGSAMLAAPRLYDERLSLPAMLLLIIAGWYAAVFIHESGHALAGTWSGGRFLYMSVGLAKVVRNAKGWRLTRQRKIALGGLTAVAPPLDRPVAPYMTKLVAGGPLASLLSALLAFAVLFQTSGHVRTVLATYALMSSCCFVIAMMPLSTSGFFTDGTRLLIAARGGMRAERMNAMATMHALLAAGTRMREMPASMLTFLENSIDESREGLVAVLSLHACALDRGDIAAADEWLRQSLAMQELWPASLRASLFLEAAYMAARHHNDAAAARRWFGMAKGAPFTEKSARLLCEAAVLIAEGRIDEARSALATATRHLDETPCEGVRKMLLDQSADLERLASELRSQTSTAAAD